MSSHLPDNYIGYQIEKSKGALHLVRPIQRGIVHNWDDTEKLLGQAFQELRADPAEHNVLLTEAPLNPKSNRIELAQHLFEQHEIPNIYFMQQSVASLYSAGRTTGTVVVILL